MQKTLKLILNKRYNNFQIQSWKFIKRSERIKSQTSNLV